MAFNRAVREEDEWFEEPDDLPRVQRALNAIADVEDPVDAAAVLAYRGVRAQAFGEGNKRTACFSLAGYSIATGSTVHQSCLRTTVSSPTFW